jgi:hypothetical protein
MFESGGERERDEILHVAARVRAVTILLLFRRL